MSLIFEVPKPSVAIANSDQRFPVHRIYCVGKNYAMHALEMGGDPSKEAPCFFSKPADAIVNGVSEIPFASNTANLHYEVELVLAVGKQVQDVTTENALDCLYGYAVGIDLTKRDLQNEAKNAGRPWDVAKGFDNSAPISAIHPVTEVGLIHDAGISLQVNGETKQQGDIADMTLNPAEIIVELSSYYVLQPGDLIFTGTPAGVGALKPGDELTGAVEGLDEVRIRLV